MLIHFLTCWRKFALAMAVLFGARVLFAQSVVMNYGANNTFTASGVATNFVWTLDGVAVGGNSNSFAYAPQVSDVGTHYLLANETFPGGSTSNAYWGVRVSLLLPVSGANYYVATNGSDSNPGTLALPFLTLEQARNTIRALARPLPAGGVTVWLRGGTYYRTNTLMLTNVNDSGSATAPVVYCGYPGESAVISGGKPIPAASWVPLNALQTNRVAPGVNPTNIWELDVASAGIIHAVVYPADFNQWTVYNTYEPSVSGGMCELMYNDQRQFVSRYPPHNLTNDDLLTTNLMMDGVAAGSVPAKELIYADDSTNSLNYPGVYTNSSGQAIAVGGAFYCYTNDVARFTQWETAFTNGGLWLQGYWRVPWQIDGVKIIGFDAPNRAVLFATNAAPGNGIGSKYARPAGYKTEPYWALNLLEAMAQPGEWCVDFNRNKIYFYAPGPLLNGSVVVSDFASPLVQIGGNNGVVSNVVFESLNLEDGLAQGFFITNGMDNLVLGCNLYNLGNYPVDINNGWTNGVVSSNLHDLAGGGVLLRGGYETNNAALRVPARDFVVNNVITNFGRVARVYAAAVDAGFGGAGGSGGGGGHTTCVGMRVAHNNISISPHCAILHGSWDNTFEYDNIGYYQQVSDDLGGFYSDDLISRHGNQTFRYNFLHDTPLGNGIDFDGDYLDMNIYGNVMNLNTVPAESQGIGVRYQDADQGASGDQQSVNCYNNLVADTHLGISFVALLPSVIQNNGAIDCTAAFTWEQVVVGTTNNTIVSSSQAAMESGPNQAYASDPGFIGLTNDDLRLVPTSEIYTNLPGFQQIPFELIGLYNDEYRTNAGGYSPYVATASAAYVTSSNAACNGQLYFPQFASNTTITIYYGLTDGGSNAGAWQFSTNLGVFPAGPLSALVGRLEGGTNYYFRYFAANAYGSAWSPASSSLVTPPPPPLPVITNVNSQVVLAGSTVTLAGQVVATGLLYPAAGETVGVTINGSTQTGLVSDSTGDFSVSYSTTNLTATPTPYPVVYAYGGDTNLSSATNGNTTLTVVPASVVWTGGAGTNFETGGSGGNWSGYPAPLNDLVSCTAVFANPPTVNQPSLTLSRSVNGLSFGATAGGWTLGSGATNIVLNLGAGGITAAGQTSGANVISASVQLGANQTWQAGTGGNLLVTGSVTNTLLNTNYSLTINASGNLGNVILSPAAGNRLELTGSNNTASIFQVKSGGLLQLGGDGITVPATTSTNWIVNTATNAYGALGLNAPGYVKVNSGTWIFSDLGKNGGDRFTGTLEVDGGVLSFGGARYLGEGTIQMNGGLLKVGVDTGSHYINGGRFTLGSVFTSITNTAVVNVTGGFVDLAQANGGNSIGGAIGTLLNQSGGVLQNGVTPGTGGTTTAFTIGGLPGSGTTNNLTAFTLAGGTFISAGTVAAATNAGPGSVNNFNFMGGVLAVSSFNATNLGSSPLATAAASQANVSLAFGTLVNYGGTLAPGNFGVPGKTMLLGNYAVSNSTAALAIDIGGTNQANAFQNGVTNYDFLAVSGGVTLGGSLNVSLLSGFVPAATNSFVILTNGGVLTGSFTNLAGGRVAVTNVPGASFLVVTTPASVLLTNFQVLPASQPPLIGGLGWSGTNLVLTGTNGTAGADYYVLITTNLSVQPADWSLLATNQFGPGGSFNFTSPAVGGRNFYRLKLP